MSESVLIAYDGSPEAKRAVEHAGRFLGCTTSYILTIRDDGHGAPADRLNTGNGIRGMRERAEMVGGTLDLESSPRGTTVRATLPVDARTPCIDEVKHQ